MGFWGYTTAPLVRDPSSTLHMIPWQTGPHFQSIPIPYHFYSVLLTPASCLSGRGVIAGSQMLRSLGWREGQGLGREGGGITEPVTARGAQAGGDKGGLGSREPGGSDYHTMRREGTSPKDAAKNMVSLALVSSGRISCRGTGFLHTQCWRACTLMSEVTKARHGQGHRWREADQCSCVVCG